MNLDFSFEYLYDPSPNAEDRISKALDLILDLIFEDYLKDQNFATLNRYFPAE